MAKEIVLFKSEERKELHGVCEFLHQLADKLASGQVILQKGSEQLELTVPDKVVLEIKVEEESKHNKKKHSLEIEIEWVDGDQSGESVSLG